MNEPFEKQTIAGWGRYEPQECHVYRPERREALPQFFKGAEEPHYIARGLGRSYGDPAVNDGGGVINMQRLNRMLAFEPATGILECEAGVSLAEIVETFVARGFFLPVTPGTKFVTVGGAIANDVHGKNHHRDGTFGQFVESLRLLTPAGETLTCSPQQNADVFWATVGGVGLTGIILTARIRLQPVPSAWVRVDYYKAANLDDCLATMSASDDRYKYSVAWVDCLASGSSLGRSVLMRGNHADAGEAPSGQDPHMLPARGRKGIPADFPGFVLNPLSIRAFNTLYYGMHKTIDGKIIDYDSYFYPLDGIQHWNRMYGKRGFVQYQATLPPDSVNGLVKILERLSQSRRASFLAVLKGFGEANPGLLSHPFYGYTLTLDIPNRPGLVPFLRELDRILLDHGGRLYLAKDAATAPETIAAMYPRLEEFKAIQRRIDPERRLSSAMARRLHLVEDPKHG